MAGSSPGQEIALDPLVRPWYREEPGDKRLRRLATSDAYGATVLMRGRSPDGALFEFGVEHSADFGACMFVWFPFASLEGSGGCTQKLGFPPSTAYGRRNPEEMFAKTYGFLNAAPEATTYRVISGFARPKVARVDLIYLDRDGGRHEAPLKVVQVAGPVLEKIKASEPFGYWVAFVPRSAGHQPIEVIAYGGGGDRLSTFTLQNP